MDVAVADRRPWEVRADVLAIALPDRREWDEGLSEVDRRVRSGITAATQIAAVGSRPYDSILLPSPELASRFVLALGAPGSTSLEVFRLGAAIARRLRDHRLADLAIYLPFLHAARGGKLRSTVELLVRGVIEGGHQPRAVGSEQTVAPGVERLTILVDQDQIADAKSAAWRGSVIGSGCNRARALTQRAGNDVFPEALADEASAIAAANGLQAEIIGLRDAEAAGMGMFSAVGRGSDHSPFVIVLRNGDAPSFPRKGRSGGDRRLLALVGKGVTFDSGGLNLKAEPKMRMMRMDKAGACTVISAIATAGQLSPETPLLAIAPAVENMPGPRSMRPGDVVRSMNGKTVEITNTDAEGRLILGDALSLAERKGATHLIDVATLTGASRAALGNAVVPGFSTDTNWTNEIAAAAAAQAERIQMLPLIDEYLSDLRSIVADLRNAPEGEGELVKSALFLRQFTTRPWAHFDIAGAAWLESETTWMGPGATGVLHATLVELATGGHEKIQRRH